MPGQADQHLQVEAGALVLARPQVRLVLPTPARQEGPIDDVHAPMGDLLDGGQHGLQGPGDDSGDHGDRPRDHGLGHPMMSAIASWELLVRRYINVARTASSGLRILGAKTISESCTRRLIHRAT